MTKFQREKHKKLVQELKQRRERGEKYLIIFNGEIVLRRDRNPKHGTQPMLQPVLQQSVTPIMLDLNEECT